MTISEIKQSFFKRNKGLLIGLPIYMLVMTVFLLLGANAYIEYQNHPTYQVRVLSHTTLDGTSLCVVELDGKRYIAGVGDFTIPDQDKPRVCLAQDDELITIKLSGQYALIQENDKP